MKKYIIPIGTLLLSGLSQAQLTDTENYVQSKTYLDYNGAGQPSKTVETVQYVDGLGRPKQIVNVKASPLGRDVVTHITYDEFGRQLKDYLPVPQAGTLNGAIVQSPLANASSTPYGSEKIYAEKVLENSPLDRILEQKQVGNAWNGKPVKFDYDANTSEDYVKKYETTTTWTEGRTQTSVQLTQYFGPSQLYKNTVTDEDGNKNIEFKNGKGQVILVRKVLNASENADTYYVYNEYDQLAFVIPPLASAPTVEPATMENLYYQYRYDGKNRLVEKKLPGKGWEYMVYDKADKLILTQDANQRTSFSWMIYKYDAWGRPIYTGILTANNTRPGMQSQISDTSVIEGKSITGLTANDMTYYYSNMYWGLNTLLSVTYYDSYPRLYDFNPPFPSTILGEPVLTETPDADGRSTKGLPVMSLVKNIEDNSWTKTYTYYDQKGRVIGTHSINHLGGYTQTESKLDFAGTVQKAVTRHKRLSTDTERVITENFTYDHQNRLLVHKHQIDNNPEEILMQNSYNELSQLETKKVGGTSAASPLQTINYQYNIRGWMTQINDPDNLGNDLFGYKINYNQVEGLETPNNDYSSLKVKPKFNGNIAEVSWKTLTEENEPIKRYGYVYDGLNRLSAGFYQKQGNETAKEYFEIPEYDLNGNITRLKRSAALQTGNTAAVMIDDLRYDYTGNKLTKVTDAQQNPSGYPYLASPGTIGYDNDNVSGNGNMTSHPDKGISLIQYNYLNLPKQITQNSNLTQYTYRADGVKVKKLFKNLETYYLDGFQYKSTFGIESWNGEGTYHPSPNEIPVLKLRIIPTSEGYYDDLLGQYVYNYTDHLGNVRLSYADKSGDGIIQPRRFNASNCTGWWCIEDWRPGEIVEVNNYYPFGLLHNYTATTQNAYQYKYNGKELQETGMYDYGARMYMPDLGRWGVVDPLAEKMTRHSPYNYAFNNPIKHTDPDGKEPLDIIFRGTDKKEIRIIAAGPDKVYNVPFALNKNTTLDIGIGNIDPGRLAVGYTAQGDIGGGLGIGAGGGVQASVIQFTDSKYSGYNYVYAGAQESFSAGAQANISASLGGSVSVAYNTSKDNIDPTSYAGVTTSAGLSADVKYVVGGGVNVNAFSGSGKNPGWKGVSIGVSVGVGAGANVGSGNVTLSNTWLLNDVKPTAQRSLLDRTTNAISPVGSAVATGIGNWVKKNVKHSPQFN